MEEQVPPQVRSTPYQSPLYNFGSSIILLTNPENELYKMELTLRSMVVDKEGNPDPVGKPLMNDIGISSIIGITQAIVNQVTIMSNLSKNEVPMLIDFLGDTLAKDLMMNRVKYDIKTASARDKIFFTVLSSAFICMKRAYEEGDKRFWKGATQEITTRVEGQQKKSALSNVLGWKK